MEKIYMMEIRDLTNEAEELNAQTIKVKAFEKEVSKRIKILAESHISVITSYLNHQLDEVAKFTNSFSVEIFDFEEDERIGLWIEKKKDAILYVLKIKPYGYSAINFIINDFNGRSCEVRINEITPIFSETLIKNWSKLKKQLQYNIQKEVDNVQRKNEEKQARLREKLALYENFEI